MDTPIRDFIDSLPEESRPKIYGDERRITEEFEPVTNYRIKLAEFEINELERRILSDD